MLLIINIKPKFPNPFTLTPFLTQFFIKNSPTNKQIKCLTNSIKICKHYLKIDI